MRNVRLIYTKTGRMKFVSHLDMNRFFIRLFRIANVPVWYTEGFNKHVYISFALPLSLGFESMYEIADFRIVDDAYTDEMLLADLNAHTVDGIKFVDAFEPVLKAKFAVRSVYRISVKNVSADILDEFFHRPRIISEKRNKKGEYSEIEISHFIEDLLIASDNDGAVINITLPSGNDISINPVLFFSAFEKETGIICEYHIVRTAVLDSDKKIFR